MFDCCSTVVMARVDRLKIGDFCRPRLTAGKALGSQEVLQGLNRSDDGEKDTSDRVM